MDAPTCKLCNEKHWGPICKEGSTARAASGPENNDRYRKVWGSTPHLSASLERAPEKLEQQHPPSATKFDRQAYQRVYMKKYMKQWRAKKITKKI